MDLYQQIQTNKVNAQKEGNVRLLAALRLMVAEINYAKGNREVIEDQEVVKVLRGEAKKRKESADIYTQIGNKAKADQENYELEVINAYLPAQMDESKIKAEIDKIALSSGKRGGPLVGEVMRTLGGQADGGQVKRMVDQYYAK